MAYLQSADTLGCFVRDQVAEGEAETDHENEAAERNQTRTMPVIKASPYAHPAAETGLLSAIAPPFREGMDDHERQDAKRTTDETQVAPMPEQTTTPDARPRLKVLIVEDTIELAEVIQGTLETMNLEVVHEINPVRAVTRFEALKPDLVLLDIQLPEMSGWKFLETIKATHGDRLPIIVVITAFGDPANRLVGKLQGVHDYLIKPFAPDTIQKVVSGALKL